MGGCNGGTGTVCRDNDPMHTTRICTCTCPPDPCAPTPAPATATAIATATNIDLTLPIVTTLITKKLKPALLVAKKAYTFLFLVAKILVTELIVIGWLWYLFTFGYSLCDLNLTKLLLSDNLLTSNSE